MAHHPENQQRTEKKVNLRKESGKIKRKQGVNSILQ